MNIKNIIQWDMILGSIVIQSILLFINSFFSNNNNILAWLFITFIFYTLFSLITKINIINKIFNNSIVAWSFFILIIVAIYDIYSTVDGFISSTLISMSILWFGLTLAILIDTEKNEITISNDKDIYWKDRLVAYEKAKENN